MISLKIEVRPLTGRVVTLSGDSKPARFYLHPREAVAHRSASLGDRLNDTAMEFLPCDLEDETSLLRVDWIAYVEVAETPPEVAELEEVGAIHAEVELDLVTGETLTGDLLVEGGASQLRVSDYLNKTSQRFVVLRAAAGTLYLNRRAIARVRL